MFHRSGSDFIGEVALQLRLERFNAGEKVAVFNTKADKMYIMVLGSVRMATLNGRHISGFIAGDYFGEYNLIRTQVHLTNVTCYDFCEMWVLDKSIVDSSGVLVGGLDEVLRRFPVIRRVMHRIMYDAHLDPALGNVQGAHKGLAGCPNFRKFSVVYAEDGRTLLPSRFLIEPHDDPVVILRWNYMVTRVLRRLYVNDDTTRIYNALSSFNLKMWGGKQLSKSQRLRSLCAPYLYFAFIWCKTKPPHVGAGDPRL